MSIRWIWWAALIAGISFTAAAWAGWGGPAVIAWKGAGVGLLALWLAVQARSVDGWLAAGVMTLGAIGDVLLDAVGTVAGAAFFLAGHAVAILLYGRNRRAPLSASQRLLARLTPVATVGIALACTIGTDMVLTTGIYAAFLGTMAGFAWASHFPRYRVGMGAMLFLASDLLIFSRAGPLAGSVVPDILVWPLYFAGQAMIARGIAATLGAAPTPR